MVDFLLDVDGREVDGLAVLLLVDGRGDERIVRPPPPRDAPWPNRCASISTGTIKVSKRTKKLILNMLDAVFFMICLLEDYSWAIILIIRAPSGGLNSNMGSGNSTPNSHLSNRAETARGCALLIV